MSSLKREQDDILNQFLDITAQIAEQVEQYDMTKPTAFEDNPELWAMEQFITEFKILGFRGVEAENMASRIPVSITVRDSLNDEQIEKIDSCISNMAQAVKAIHTKIHQSDRWDNPDAIFHNMVSQMEFNLEL